MSLHQDQVAGDRIEAARRRHPSNGPQSGCADCDADGRGRFVPCAEHRVMALHRTYTGVPDFGACEVVVTESTLLTGEVLATWPLRNPRPDRGGYSWGYSGNGAYILAESVLRDALGEVNPRRWDVEDFCVQVIANCDHDEPFTLSQLEVLDWKYDRMNHKGGSAVAR